MAFALPDLPYASNALEPHMSANTLSFHHGKHHKAYVDKTNELIQGTAFQDMGVEEIIKKSANDSDHKALFNNAAQLWNHSFFWNCLKPGGGGAPSGELAKRIEQDLGGLDKFKAQFKAAAVGQFGSGWAWLVLDDGTLKITATANAVSPMVAGQKALLTCDVWEHAYYLDYQNRRPDFVDAFLNHLVNWDFAAQQL